MPNITPRLILASGSPRRKSLLAEWGYDFDVVVPRPEAECGICSSDGPAALVKQLAQRKAADVAQQLASQPRSPDASAPSWLLLAADTVAECQGQILGKPVDECHARRMLEQMRGREHRVYTGICLWSVPATPESQPLEPHLDSLPQPHYLPQPHVESVVTRLRMDSLTDSQIDDYLASDAWQGKAGAFGYQDGLDWVHLVVPDDPAEGSESNVVGLPMERLAELFSEFQLFTSPHR